MRPGLAFLLRHMPARDLRSLPADYLLENVRYAYRAWREAPWHKQVSEPMFFNYILPYANVSERRDRWRREFYRRFKPLVREARSPAEAAVILNRKIFPLLGVKYSTARRRADQGPLETIELGLASCTGLSILLVDACRAVGVPARLVGTPRWSDGSGNHTWVEIWDRRWHFTGAAEPTGQELNRAWFLARAARARRDHPLHAIYAVSFRRTPLVFPMVWAREADPVWAHNVTDRYTSLNVKLPPGKVRVMFRALAAGRQRVPARLRVRDSRGKLVFSGRTKDERFDANDHLTVVLQQGEQYRAEFDHQGKSQQVEFTAREKGQLVSVRLVAAQGPKGPPANDPLQALRRWLKQPNEQRPELARQPFARVPLSRLQAEQAARLLWEDHRRFVRRTRAAEMRARAIEHQKLRMRFWYKIYGKPGPRGYPLFISLHGGGAAPARVNDTQWENQKRLYRPRQGVYLVPRAPTNTWNLWHQAHIDPMFRRLIENLIVFENVDPDRVYLLGYSAGGDGVYQLAPRMADSFAAASMMAGHPNETSPLGLRNLPFSLHVGAEDAAYDRNKVARRWIEHLARLRRRDPGGYEHWGKIYPGKGHWLHLEDAKALPWMARFRRNRFPDRVVWKQDDVTHARFYWLAVPPKDKKPRSLIVVRRKGQRFTIESSDVSRLGLLLNDEFVDLDRPVEVVFKDRVLYRGKPARTIVTVAETLRDRGDPRMVFSARVWVDVP